MRWLIQWISESMGSESLRDSELNESLSQWDTESNESKRITRISETMKQWNSESSSSLNQWDSQ